ncbi:phosphopentomutase [Primorskyibacter sp. S187A]|uniref:phosphopentomutase n=1 Tax=Primorskyibacter sp. S187A TaxID=3415130 RepID=UPI003C7CF84F
MSRAFLVVMDSVGIGGAPDADTFFNGDVPDTGANTLAHIVDATGLFLPTLDRMGLGAACALASGVQLPGWSERPDGAGGCWAVATEQSRGKDTPSGHWELAGLLVPWEWHYFPDTQPSFPKEISALAAKLAGVDGILGDCHASGTDILSRLGEAHMQTGQPICYTSADSVFQIAAHEETFGLERLLQLCSDMSGPLHDMRVGRVIARPFVGTPGNFKRTQNRRDYAMTPPEPILTNWAQDAGRLVHTIGKIKDIFAGQGVDTAVKGADVDLMQELHKSVDNLPDGSLCFANFVEFDSLYGHRRDPQGYAQHLSWFDGQIAKLLPILREGDLLVITADHGNDPTWVGTDHTRERVPVLVHGAGSGSLGGSLGHVAFADVAASVAAHLGLTSSGPGRSFL